MCRALEQHGYAAVIRINDALVGAALTISDTRFAHPTAASACRSAFIRPRVARVFNAALDAGQLIGRSALNTTIGLRRAASKADPLTRDLKAIAVLRTGQTGIRTQVA